MYELSNFYQDYSANPQMFQDVFKMYEKIVQVMVSYVTQVGNNNILSNVETYRTVPIQFAKIDEATYDIVSVVNNTQYIRQKYSPAQPITNDSKQSFWDSLTIDDKIDILDYVQKYILLMIRRNDVLDKPLPKVVDLELYDEANNRLVVNYDYVLRNNKIYLINLDISAPTENVKYCLKNISIDMNTPDKLLGERVKLAYNEILTKPEYRQICQMLLYGALGGPTIKNMENALSSIMQMSNAKIYDKYNADELRKGYWNQDGDVWSADKLSDFDFLVSLPNDFINNTDKLNLFKTYINIIKPSYTNFIVSLLYPFFDALQIKDKDIWTSKVFASAFKDNITGIEQPLFQAIRALSDSLTTNLLNGDKPNFVSIVSPKDTINRLESLSAFLQKSDLFDKIIVNEITSQGVNTQVSDSITNLGEQLYRLDVKLNYFDACIAADKTQLPLSSVQGNIFCDNINVKYFK